MTYDLEGLPLVEPANLNKFDGCGGRADVDPQRFEILVGDRTPAKRPAGV